jgi:hypothetical protein
MKKLNSSTQGAISYSTKRSGRQALNLLRLTLLVWSGSAGMLQAEDLGTSARLFLMKSQAETRAFYRHKEDLVRSKELERVQIPQYNVDLSLTLSRFHKHIADMHHRHVTCSICREHVKKIKQLAKKIDQGMK